MGYVCGKVEGQGEQCQGFAKDVVGCRDLNRSVGIGELRKNSGGLLPPFPQSHHRAVFGLNALMPGFEGLMVVGKSAVWVM